MAKKDAAPAPAPAEQEPGTVTSLATTEPGNALTKEKEPSKALRVHEDTGFEDFTQSDLMVPFLVILQKNSPQVEEENPKHVAGAKAGMFMNTVTGELFDGKAGITVIPVHRLHQYLEWIPRDDGGGLVAVHERESQLVRETLAKAGRKFGKLKVNDNNDLVETFNVFALLRKPDGSLDKVVLGFSSSQIGPYKKWMTNAMGQTKLIEGGNGARALRPLWSHRYRVTTVFNTNKKGSWYKYDVIFDGGTAEGALYPDDAPEQKEAKDFRALLLSGAAQANFESATRDAADGADEDQYEM